MKMVRPGDVQDALPKHPPLRTASTAHAHGDLEGFNASLTTASTTLFLVKEATNELFHHELSNHKALANNVTGAYVRAHGCRNRLRDYIRGARSTRGR